MKLCRRLLLCLPLLHGASATAVDGDWYVGAGGGVSRLTPDTDGSPFSLEESTSAAVGAFGGREFGRRYAVELGATRLGEAGLSDDQSVDYTVISGGVLGYVLGDLPRVRRGEAAGGYLKLGLGAIDNASDVPLEREDNVAIWVGVGADVPLGRVWGLRAELASFDGDAQAATVALVWRPRRPTASGPIASRGRDAAVAADPTPIPDPAPLPAPVPAPIPAPSPEAAPEPAPAPTPAPAERRTAEAVASPPAPPADCPAPAAGEPVDGRGCARFSGVLEGVEFAPGGAVLTEAGRAELDRLAAELVAEPGVTVEIRAHVATGAGPDAAKALSRERAIATARHLAGRGVPVARLRARAFGDERPRTDGGPDDRIELAAVRP